MEPAVERARSGLRDRNPGAGPAAHTREANRAELADFLRRRREALRPAELGLPAGPRRRTPGLRRDEVARLAHMSAVYYERLEQARAPQPSASLLAGLAGALRLSDDERSHLYLLAGQAPPAPTEVPEEVDRGLSYLLHDVGATTAALISDDLGNVLAQNVLNTALFGDVATGEGRTGNMHWLWFSSAEWRARLRAVSAEEDEATGLAYVADLRATLARRGHDPVATAFVDELRSASVEFAVMWQQHRVSNLPCHRKIVFHVDVGRLDLDCAVVLSPLTTQRLLILQPVPDTGTVERLRQLLISRPNRHSPGDCS